MLIIKKILAIPLMWALLVLFLLLLPLAWLYDKLGKPFGRLTPQ